MPITSLSRLSSQRTNKPVQHETQSTSLLIFRRWERSGRTWGFPFMNLNLRRIWFGFGWISYFHFVSGGGMVGLAGRGV